MFVSSTFLDMHEEREALIKKVFPRLRDYCRDRSVSVAEVDLRWGVTERQSERGRTLSICLEEVDRCRPFFIGILGDRYGSVAEITASDLKIHPWLSGLAGSSLTEIEIEYAVLSRRPLPERAVFYFRAASSLRAHRDPEHSQRLEALKQRIRQSGVPLREGYTDGTLFSEWVYNDLKQFIDAAFPESVAEVPDEESRRQAHFVASRARVYVGGDEYQRRLDACLRGPSLTSRSLEFVRRAVGRHPDHSSPSPGRLIAVTGPPGAGKSALLSHWVANRRQESTRVMATHFVAASPLSCDWQHMIDRLSMQLCAGFDMPYQRPSTAEETRYAFAGYLAEMSGRGGAVLVIDGLDRLEDSDGAQELSWLPSELPEAVVVVASTLPGKALEALVARQASFIDIQPLDRATCRTLVTRYLREFSKTLESDHIDALTQASVARNPLFLRSVLGELRVLGDRARLRDAIASYLSVKDLPALFARILERCEQDFDSEQLPLVGRTMSLLSRARSGLSEPELLDLLGSDDNPLPQAYWSPLLGGVEQFLTIDTGLINFAHNAFREAVESRYLRVDAAKLQVHAAMADYFAAETRQPRAPAELGWHLSQTAQWQRLRSHMKEPAFARALASANEDEFKRLWVQIEEQTGIGVKGAYEPPVLGPSTAESGRSWIRLATALYRMGCFSDARAISEPLVAWSRTVKDESLLQECLGVLGQSLVSSMNLDAGWDVFKEREAICRKLGDTVGLRDVLGPIAIVLMERGRIEEARSALVEQETLARRHGNLNALQAGLGDQVLLFSQLGDREKVMSLHGEEERICRQIGNQDGLARSLMNQSSLWLDQGDTERARTTALEAERLHREIGDVTFLAIDMYNLGRIALKTHDWLEADTRFGEGLALCEKHELLQTKGALLKGRIEALRRSGSYRLAWHLAHELKQFQMVQGNLEEKVEALEILMWLTERQGNLTEARALRMEIVSLLEG